MSNIFHIIDAFWQNPTISKILPKTQLQQRFANGVFWSFIGSITSQILNLIATIPIARLLSAKGYGEIGIIQSTLMTFVIFSGPSLGQTATKYIAELRHKDTEKVGRIIGLTTSVGFVVSAILSFFLYAGASYLATHTLNAPQLTTSLSIAAIALFFNGVNGAQLGTLTGFETFRSIANINVIRGFVSLPLLVLGAKYGGVNGVVIALTMVSLFTTYITQRAVNKIAILEGVKINYWKSFSEWHVLTSFYIPTVLSGLVFMPVVWSANALLVNQINGYKEMGIFNAANQWRMAVQFLPSIISQPMLPILSSLYGKKLLDDFRRILKLNINLVIISTLLPSLLIVSASRWIMKAYGTEFINGTYVLITLMVTSVFVSLSAIVGTAISSIGKRWHAAGLNLLWAILFLILSYKLVQYGAIGLAISYLLSYIIHFCNSIIYSSSLSNLKLGVK